jgi:hypothetical protein
MNVQRESQLGAHAIMWAVMNKPQEVRDLFSRNGMRFPIDINNPNNVPSGSVLAELVVKAIKNSKPFRADFLALMAQYPDWATSYMSMNGEFANFGGGVADFSLNLNNPKGGETPKKSWFTADNIQSTLNTGLNAFLTLDKNKTDRELAKASENVAMYNSQSGGTTGGGAPTPKPNTMLNVFYGVIGLALVGGLIFVASKKR